MSDHWPSFCFHYGLMQPSDAPATLIEGRNEMRLDNKGCFFFSGTCDEKEAVRKGGASMQFVVSRMDLSPGKATWQLRGLGSHQSLRPPPPPL